MRAGLLFVISSVLCYAWWRLSASFTGAGILLAFVMFFVLIVIPVGWFICGPIANWSLEKDNRWFWDLFKGE